MKQIIRKNLSFNSRFLVSIFLLIFSSVNIFGSYDITPPSGPVKFSEWDVVGPNGGDVRVVSIDPKDKDRMYVSTLDGQIHTSTDGGKNWRLLVNLNKPQLVLDQMMIDSRDSSVIYTSGHRHKEPGGFFKSTDGGATWKEAKELRNESLHAMVQSTKNPDLILVGGVNGVWKSENSGDDWQKIESSTLPINVDSIAVDPTNTNIIYAGTWWRAFKTTDGGKSWRVIVKGMIDDSDVFAVTIDHRNPDHLVSSACSGIYESYNKGETWKKIQGIPSDSRRTRDIVQHPTKPGVIYAATTGGFWMSTNGGKNWALTTQKDLEINSIAVHPDDPDRVFIGTNNYGVMVSTDGGRNFTQTNDSFTSRFTYTITADIEQPNRLYATTHNTATGGGFVFISNDGGNNWVRPKNFDVLRVSPYGLIQDRTNPNTLYLASSVGMFISLDRGDTWTQIIVPKPKTTPKKKPVPSKKKPTKAKVEPAPVPAAPVLNEYGLIVALTEKVKILAYTEDGKNGIFAGTDKGLYRSYDLAKGWEKISLGEGLSDNIFAIYSIPQRPETIWVGTEKSGVIVSRDNGQTWQTVSGIPRDVPISTITSDPKRPENMYVGTSQTFYLSRDAGKTWTRRGGNLPLGNYTSILINPNDPDEIFISSALETDGGIFYSNDAGWNWKRIDSKEMKIPSRRVWSMIFDPNNPSRIFAATHSSGVYRIERAPTAAKSDAVTRPRITTSGN